MLFGLANFLGLKFVQGEMKNESSLGGGKYSKKVFYENGASD